MALSKKMKIGLGIGLAAVLAGGFFFLKKKSPYEGLLIQASNGGNGEVYLVENGKKRWLRSWEIGAKYGLTPSIMQQLSFEIISSIPTGDDIAS